MKGKRSGRSAVYAVGVDIGGTAVKSGIVSSDGKILQSLSRPTGRGRAAVLLAVRASVETLLKESSAAIRKGIRGIGVVTPGLTDAKGKVVSGAANIPGWNGTPLGEHLRKAFRMPVRAENDVTALTLGESLFGAGRPFRNFIALAFGTGLGGGIIIGKRIYRGRDGYAAEFGHMIVDSSLKAPACTCGGRGCLETYASRVGIERLVREILPRYPHSALKSGSSPRDVYGLAAAGDPAAREIVKEVGEHLGAGLASLVNIFNPEGVLLGGGIANAGKIFLDSFRPSYERRVLAFHVKRRVKFLSPRFGSEGGIVGAAALILQDLFHSEQK